MLEVKKKKKKKTENLKNSIIIGSIYFKIPPIPHFYIQCQKKSKIHFNKDKKIGKKNYTKKDNPSKTEFNWNELLYTNSTLNIIDKDLKKCKHSSRHKKSQNNEEHNRGT